MRMWVVEKVDVLRLRPGRGLWGCEYIVAKGFLLIVWQSLQVFVVYSSRCLERYSLLLKMLDGGLGSIKFQQRVSPDTRQLECARRLHGESDTALLPQMSLSSRSECLLTSRVDRDQIGSPNLFDVQVPRRDSR